MIISRRITGFKIPSVNEIWRRGRYSTYLKAEVVELKKKLDPKFDPINEDEKKLFNEKVNLCLRFGFNSISNKDVDNYAKIPIDSIKTRLIEDDTQITTLVMMKEEIEGDETLSVDIRKDSDNIVAIFDIDFLIEMQKSHPEIISKLILTEAKKLELARKCSTFLDSFSSEFSYKANLTLLKEKIFYPDFKVSDNDIRRLLRDTTDIEYVLKLQEKYASESTMDTFKNKITKLNKKPRVKKG